MAALLCMRTLMTISRMLAFRLESEIATKVLLNTTLHKFYDLLKLAISASVSLTSKTDRSSVS